MVADEQSVFTTAEEALQSQLLRVSYLCVQSPEMNCVAMWQQRHTRVLHAAE